MIRKVADVHPSRWDVHLDALLFAVRETPQASTGVSPFELLYGRQPRGLMEVVRDQWAPLPPRAPRRVEEYLGELRQALETASALAQSNLGRAQERQRREYDRTARARQFQVGDRVLVRGRLFPTLPLVPWRGPFPVVRTIGNTTCEVQCGDSRRQKRVIHMNQLKRWHEPPAEVAQALAGLVVDPDDDQRGWETHNPGNSAWPQRGPELTSHQQSQLDELLHQWGTVFSSVPGRTTLVQHQIETAPGVEVRTPWRPIPRKRWEAVEKEVQEMLRAEVIEPSRSGWRSPIVLVPKPDGSIRFCIDFRELNKRAKFDAYPMPRTEVLLDRLGEARYLSSLDLTKGYWQIPLREIDREKTAFATPSGLYQFKVMPFGLHGAAATFQRLVDRVLGPCRAFCVAYIDDILIFSHTWGDHLDHLRRVLRALQEAGLHVNPKKSVLAAASLKYLGHIIGQGQVMPLPEKIKALQEFPRPKSKKQLRQFMGLAGYYSRFIPGFAGRASPLTDLLRGAKQGQLQWSGGADAAFQDIRTALCSSSVLHCPDFSRPFLVQTDASATGLGAVLAQEFPEGERPIAYLSRKLQPAETRYATIEREALAVKWAVSAWRYYLTDNHFHLITDHAPLLWMERLKDHNDRVQRWYLALSPFSFTVRHRKGSQHANADCLSRRFEDESPAVAASAQGGG